MFVSLSETSGARAHLESLPQLCKTGFYTAMENVPRRPGLYSSSLQREGGKKRLER